MHMLVVYRAIFVSPATVAVVDQTMTEQAVLVSQFSAAPFSRAWIVKMASALSRTYMVPVVTVHKVGKMTTALTSTHTAKRGCF